MGPRTLGQTWGLNGREHPVFAQSWADIAVGRLATHPPPWRLPEAPAHQTGSLGLVRVSLREESGGEDRKKEWLPVHSTALPEGGGNRRAWDRETGSGTVTCGGHLLESASLGTGTKGPAAWQLLGRVCVRRGGCGGRTAVRCSRPLGGPSADRGSPATDQGPGRHLHAH